ncbi:MAG: hypothetical protein KIT31_29745 [Deltaproteobacteria bacterium]|nr:hypothetical protein [Deltaproteobacteria bacterium]
MPGRWNGWQRAARNPGWQLVAGCVLLAVLFPSNASGSIALIFLSGAAGIAVAAQWPQLPPWIRTPSPRVATALVVALVVVAGLSAFWETLTVSPDWMMGDWGPQHAVLQRAMPSFPGLDTPAWNHLVGTGDAPMELYPKLAYVVTGHTALALGMEDDLPHAMMVVAVCVHLAIAVGTTLLAMRVAPRPIALVVGLVAIVDGGAVAHGGSSGLFRWALLHCALSVAFVVAAGVGVLTALARPRLGASAGIWVAMALACIAHPAGLIAAAAIAVGLAAVALLADDVPPRRALAALAHVLIGVALGAFAWMPLADRILEYGQHFPNVMRTPEKLLEDLLQWVSPVTWYSMVGYAGYFGILAGLWSRRAPVVFLAATSLILLVGLCDAGYLALDLAPGQTVARLGTERLAQLARPFLMAVAAYGIWLFVAAAIGAWRGASARRRLVAAALIGVMAAPVIRILPVLWRSAAVRVHGETQWLAADRAGRDELTAWARARAAELGPGAWARAMFESETHEHFHLTALTGLPTFHMIWQPDLLLRERIEDTGPSSLRRFNVRWVIAADRSPSIGNPDTELRLGNFRIREVSAWDGQFARIESATGPATVRTTRLDDEAVEIEVVADAPVLVALGTGHYPRWRATHASGADEPVYALPATPQGSLSVVAAWVAPGKTTFTVDGPLPSDGAGRIPALLGLASAIAIAAVWSGRRRRVRVLRRMAALRAWVPAIAPLALRAGVPLLIAVLFVRGCVEANGPAKALLLGSGVRATATVEARAGDGPWVECAYTRIGGTYACAGILTASDGMMGLLNDATPSWAFNTPGIQVSPERTDAEVRIRFDGVRLSGTYWTATSGGGAELRAGVEPVRHIDRNRIAYSDGRRDIEVTARVPAAWQFTFVRQDTLMTPRAHLAPPPPAAPPAIRAIR